MRRCAHAIADMLHPAPTRRDVFTLMASRRIHADRFYTDSQ
jgi:hypothetical protein